jgi:hypothetical protein
VIAGSALAAACGGGAGIETQEMPRQGANSTGIELGSTQTGTGTATGTGSETGTGTSTLNPYPNGGEVVIPTVPTGTVTGTATGTGTGTGVQATGAWKGLLMTGDNSIDAFDNARKRIKQIWTSLGVDPANLRELSKDQGEVGGGVEVTNRANIRAALSGLGLGANDRCLIHMTSHGSRQGFYLVNDNTLAPDEFAQILDQTCGDRPTVVLVSACYSGVFIDSQAMQRPNRVILTAARPDRTSFGCSAENEYTYWDNCLIDHFGQAATWSDLYARVKQCISDKEGGMTPSEPQGFFGANVQSLGLPGSP